MAYQLQSSIWHCARKFRLILAHVISFHFVISPPSMLNRGGIFKLLRSPGIDSKVSVPPASVACVVKTSFGHISSIEQSKRDVFTTVI